MRYHGTAPISTVLSRTVAMTRQDTCVLNRIAQLLCGAGATEIDYKGLIPADLERLVESATKQP